MIQCDDCPIGPGCIAITSGHRPYCDWASHPDPRRLEKLLWLSGVGPAPAPTQPCLEQKPPSPSVRESLALIGRMKSCPFWSPCKTGCGSGHCGLAGGKKTSHQDCFGCLKRFG